MINEIAEVNKFLTGEPPKDRRSLYRACYMIAKYMKEDGKSPVDAVSFLSGWGANDKGVDIVQCVNAAYINETKLRQGCRVFISNDDVREIVDHSPTVGDRKVALALLCNAKAFADKKGVFQASTEAIAHWLGMQGANVRTRNITRLCMWDYVAKIETDKGHAASRFSKYRRGVSCFRMLVPFKNTGDYELVDNDIRALCDTLKLESSHPI